MSNVFERNRFFTKTPLRFFHDRVVKKYLLKLRNKRILEIGCGENSYNEIIHESNKVISTDIYSNSDTDVVSSAINLPFKSSSFDYVVCLNVLEHIYDTINVIKEIKRILKCSGRGLFSVPFFFPIHDPPHDYYRFTEYSIKKLFEDFDSVEINDVGFWRFIFFMYLKSENSYFNSTKYNSLPLYK